MFGRWVDFFLMFRPSWEDYPHVCFFFFGGCEHQPVVQERFSSKVEGNGPVGALQGLGLCARPGDRRLIAWSMRISRRQENSLHCMVHAQVFDVEFSGGMTMDRFCNVCQTPPEAHRNQRFFLGGNWKI